MKRYSAIIRTVDGRNAATHSWIAIRLMSGDKESPVTRLDNYGIDFEAGDEDEYWVEADFNGPITRVDLCNEGSDEWQPEWVKVTDPDSQITFKADFNGVRLSNGWEFRNTQVSTIETVGTSDPKPGEGEAVLKDYVYKLKDNENVKSSNGKIIATGLIQMLMETGFKPNFVSIGGAISANAVGLINYEGGVIYNVKNKALGNKAGEYMTFTSGWNIGVGVTPSVEVAAWAVPDITSLRKWSFSKSVTAQVLAGMSVSLTWSANHFGERTDNTPRIGVQLGVFTGGSIAIGAGETWGFTWVW